MASANDVKAGGAFVEAWLDRSKLTKGIAQADVAIRKFATKANKVLSSIGDGLQNFGSKAAVAGAGLLATGILGIGKAMDSLEGIAKMDQMAQSFGLTAEAATGLFGVFKAHGSDARSSMESLVTMSGAIKQALSGEGVGATLFEGLSVSAQELQGLDPAEQFFRLHAALKELEDPMERNAKLAIMFGEDGMKDLLPVLNKSNGELRAMAKSLEMTQDELDEATSATQAMKNMTAAWDKIWNKLAVSLGPTIQSIAEGLGGLFDRLSKSGTAKTLAGILIGITGLGAALVGGGGLVVALGAVVSAFGTIAGVVATVGAPLIAAGAAIAALVVGATAAAAAFIYFTDIGSTLFSTFLDGLKRLWDIFSTTMGGIVTALMDGNITGAMNVLWAGLKATWVNGITYLMDQWINLKEFLFDSFANIGTTIGNIWDGVIDFLLNGLKNFVNVVRNLPSMIANGWKGAKSNMDILIPNAGEDFDSQRAELQRRRQAAMSELDAAVRGVTPQQTRATPQSQVSPSGPGSNFGANTISLRDAQAFQTLQSGKARIRDEERLQQKREEGVAKEAELRKRSESSLNNALAVGSSGAADLLARSMFGAKENPLDSERNVMLRKLVAYQKEMAKRTAQANLGVF